VVSMSLLRRVVYLFLLLFAIDSFLLANLFVDLLFLFPADSLFVFDVDLLFISVDVFSAFF
jgi:hypothetical protein